MSLTPSLDRLVHEFQKFPGVGPKSAQRMALFLLKKGPELGGALMAAIDEVLERVGFCEKCFGICESEICDICASPLRDATKICVVEKPTDVQYIESTGQFPGLYHVLNGLISPMDFMTADKLKVNELVSRINETGSKVGELVFALPPKVEGDATIALIRRKMTRDDVKITRLAQGIPTGCEIEHLDAMTLARALNNRNRVS